MLTYSYTVVRDGSATAVDVSDWIAFDADPLSLTFRTFTFTPKLSSHVGKYEVTVVATDAGIGGDVDTKESVSAMFELEVREVNDGPEPPEAATLPQQPLQAVEGLKLTYKVPVFRDEEDDAADVPLKYTFSVVRDGSATPVDVSDWIDFDDDPTNDNPLDPLSTAFREFTFKPDESSLAGKYEVTVVATDAGGEKASATFELEVIAVNDLPEGQKLPDQDVTEDESKTYSFPKFTDEETSASALEHTASWVRKDSDGNDIKDADGEKVFVSLPTDGWIEFKEDPADDTKMQFTFSPDKSWHAEVYTLRVTAKDAEGGETFKEFILQVSAENDAPVASSLANHEVDEDSRQGARERYVSASQVHG